ncbi:MAG: ATP-binding protein [Candidatus Zipacnadales bacterium]
MPRAEDRTSTTCPCDMFHRVPMAWLVVDRQLRVIDGNQLFWKEIAWTDPAPVGTPLAEALPNDLWAGLETATKQALNSWETVAVPGLRVFSSEQPYRVVDLAVVPATTRDGDVLLIASSAVGDAGRRVEELGLLHDMVRVLRQEKEIDRVLFTILTCATAGSGGLGFNRAWVLLCDESANWLEGQMALGPASGEDARRIWTALNEQPRTLDEFVAAYDRWVGIVPNPLQETVKQLRFSMTEDTHLLPVLAAYQRRAIHVIDAETDERVDDRLRNAIGARELVVVPMLVRNRPYGVIMADNLYSGAPITEGHVRLLSLFGQHAGMAIEDALNHRKMEQDQRALEQAYVDLQQAQDEVLRTGKLAALGEMSARIAHDLRNPLVTLGGWAQVVREDPTDVETVRTAASIIAEEAANLERMLSMLLEPFAARNVQPQPTDLGQFVQDIVLTYENQARERGIVINQQYDNNLPPIAVDHNHFRRCLMNLIDNAVGAMPHGGILTLATRRLAEEAQVIVSDTGIGMTEEQRSRIFDAFYTTGHYGAGLGLAIVWDIVQAHGFAIEVESEPGIGSTFIIRIPLVENSADATVRENP